MCPPRSARIALGLAGIVLGSAGIVLGSNTGGIVLGRAKIGQDRLRLAMVSLDQPHIAGFPSPRPVIGGGAPA